MTTRLDRLLLLLSTGSTQIVRQTAAKQLGHIAAQCIARPSTSSASGSGSGGTSGGSDAYHGLDGQWADVVNLLVKVLPFLRSKQWETRTAAASAIEAIVRAAGIWEPPDYAIETTDDYTPSNGSIPIPSALASFDINDIILNTNQLLASSGAEYSGAAQGSLGKKELVKSLGLSVPGAGDDEIGIDVEEELRNGAQQQQQDTSNGLSGDFKGKGKSASPAIANLADGDIDLSKLSARERNAIKRKRKLAGNGSSALNEPPPAKSRKLDGVSQSANSSRTATPPYNTMPVKQEDTEDVKSQDTVVVAYKGPQGGQATVKDAEKEQATWIPGPEEWPFTHILASMQDNLLSADWEIRHGAALGIREILKVQGRAAGTIAGFSRWENAQQHREWASDLATSLLTVLARDRFGDFVGDQVVAPVRETAAQTLSALIVHMPKASVLEVYAHLTTMVRQEEVKAALEAQAKLDPESRQGKRNYYWEVKHAGLLGLKYLAAVHRDLFSGMKSEELIQDTLTGSFAVQSNSNRLVDDILATAILGLGDRDDDVRSVAASLLLPIAANIVDCTTSDRLLELLDMIYLSLNDLRDDLSSSVGNVMDLLSKLLTFPQVLDQVQASGESRSLQVLVPRLFPFFRHTIVGVRKAVVEAINTFLSLPRASHKGWLDERLLRLLYQNLMVEQQADIRSSTAIAWNAAIRALPDATISNTVQPYLAAWFDILMTPIGQALNIAHFWKPSEYDANASGAYNVDKAMVKQDLALVTVEAVVQCRLASMAALASLFARSRSSMEIMYGPLVSVYLTSASSHQISFANYLLASGLARQGEAQGESAFLAEVRQLVLRGLSSEAAVAYSETAGLLSQIHTQCQQLYGIAKNKGKLPASIIPVLDPPQQGFSLARAQQVINTENLALQNAMKPTNRGAAKALMDELSAKIAVEVARTAAIKESMDIQVFAAFAGATVALKQIPGKLNPLIRSLMNGIKFELNLDLQARTADVLADFLLLCEERAATLKANPSDKIVKNVCSFLCQDQTLTPLFTRWKTSTKSILTRSDFIDVDLAQLTTVQPRRGPKSGNQPIEDTETDEQRKTRIVRRGAELCLRSLTARFGDDLFRRVAMLWHAASHALVTATKDGLESFDIICSSNDSLSQEVMDCLTVLEAIVAQSPPGLPDAVAPLTGNVLIALQSKYAVIRYVAVRCMSTLCTILTEHTMKILVINVLPFIADPKSVARRRGAVQLLADIVDRLDIRILPYIIFLVVPILGRMTDPDEEVRSLATRTFALMVKLVPLEADIPDPIGFPQDLLQKREDERRFLSQLLGGGKVEEYQLPIKISVDLRKYQRDGVSWLAFLARYQLHGILCDDMGLGKTLQTICILGSKTLERAQAHAAGKSPSTVHLPSLVVCPPTLTNHWRHEIHQYAPDLTCTIYGGDRQERLQRAASLNRYDIVVMSYDVVRNDIDALGRIQWHYCVLDEGHIIKNGKTKLSKAIKTIQANHRLILSGTPIQNNVLELWNLFDFLMPGFLGTEESFNRRYGKPIQQSRDAKSSSKEQEAGALALDALHKQVLPFVLRRLKEDVLDDLPPKIIQDYYCELSPLQRDLYESFAKAGAGGDSEDNLRDDEETALPNGADDGQNTHVFQTLQYLRRLVNHPTLVIRPEQENHRRILAKHGFKGETDRNLRDISQAPKLMALKQLLLDNGIGVQSAKGEPDDAGPLNGGDGDAVAPHRVLIFCQLKNMLDLIQNSLFAEHMPSVSYMRLDGSTPPHKRHDVVQTFNADPSIDVLLLTTHVGGLGLNLTGADTVIFVEHDWNPMRDLQAMDRAHRLGQKRVVNVYRLITRGTLEEKIMGLQRFKMNIASTVVSQQNSDISDMGTDNVLDLFSGAANGDENDSGEGTKKQGKLSQKEMLQSLQELDDPSDDYKDLGDASRFADTLNS